MNVFNGERFRLGLLSYLPTSSVPTIEQVNRRESVFLMLGTSNSQICGFSIIFGRSLKKAVASKEITVEQLENLTTLFQDKNYFILVYNKRKKLYVTFRQSFDELDVLKAYFHAFLIGIAVSYLQGEKNFRVISRSRKNSPIYRLKNKLQEFSALNADDNLVDQEDSITLKAYSACKDFVDKEFHAFCKACIDQGWNVDKHLINIDDWRADWKYVESEQKEEIVERKPSEKKVSNPRGEKKSKSKSIGGNWNNLIIS